MLRGAFHCRMYYNTTQNYQNPTWAEVNDVRDVTLTLESTEADVTTRQGGGWRATVGVMKDATVEFELLRTTEADGLAAWNAFRNAYLQSSPVDMLILDGPRTVQGSQGLRAVMAITGFTVNQSLENVVSASITAKPTYTPFPPVWMDISN